MLVFKLNEDNCSVNQFVFCLGFKESQIGVFFLIIHQKTGFFSKLNLINTDFDFFRAIKFFSLTRNFSFFIKLVVFLEVVNFPTPFGSTKKFVISRKFFACNAQMAKRY